MTENVDVGDLRDKESEEGGNVQSDFTAGTAETLDEDQLLGEMGKSYEEVLRFLLTLHQRPADIKEPTVRALTDAELIVWDKEVDGM